MPISEQRKEYLYGYQKSKLKRIPLDVQKEKYEEIKAAAERAGDEHRAHDDGSNVHACVACRVLAVADDCDLIALLRLVHVDVHQDDQDEDEDPADVDAEEVG